MTTYTVTVHTLPPTLNALLRMHRMERHGVMTRIRDATILAVRSAGVPALGRARIALTRYASGNRTPDDDNLRGGCKPVIDGIVRAGVIDDDGPAYVRVTYAHRNCRVGEARVELVIEPWAGEG